MYKRIATAALVFGMMAAGPPLAANAHAQTLAPTEVQASAAKCGPRDAVIKTLKRKHGEQAQGIGLVGGKAAFEIFVSKKGSWTILLTRPNKVSCVFAAGDDWLDAPKATAAVGAPA